jgi:indolepyruvate ferredoxin oxidoreductase
VTGNPIKAELGTWVMPVFKVMAKLRGLRGSLLDPFKRSEERVLANQLIAQYEADLTTALDKMNPSNIIRVIELANLPEKIRGYGHVRMSSAQGVNTERLTLVNSL